MYPESLPNNQLRLRLSAFLLAGIAVGGCTSQDNNDYRALQPSPAPTESLVLDSPAPEPTFASDVSSAEAINCPAIFVPVYPGSRLNAENADSIDKQLEALKIAKTPAAPLGARTIFNAQAIIGNALIDSTYADAFNQVSELQPKRFPSADQLLATIVPGNSPKCLTGEQLKEVRHVAAVLVSGLGPQAGRQLSAGAKVAYSSLRDTYESFLARYRNELAN